MSKSLTFSLSEYDVDHVTVDLAAESGSFRGASACVLAERDLAAFLEAAERLALGQGSDADLVGGLLNADDVRVEMTRANRRGHLAVRVALFELPGFEPRDRFERRDRLEAHFETEPQTLIRFVEECRGAVAARREATVALFVTGGPAV